MKSKIAEAAAEPEPTVIMDEGFENPDDKFRRVWVETGADSAWQILSFLEGRRSNEVSLSEILMTETYKRSTSEEKNALRFVAAKAAQLRPLSEDDRIELAHRDLFLMQFVDGRALGHADWRAEIQSIPVAIRKSQEYDAGMFSKTWKSPVLFSWVFGQAA